MMHVCAHCNKPFRHYSPHVKGCTPVCRRKLQNRSSKLRQATRTERYFTVNGWEVRKK
jgi:hypothetical protein